MSNITKLPDNLTMSSREIATLTGKEHKNVLADIRKMLEDIGKTSAEFSADLPDAYGRMQTAFKLPKRETLILISGYSTELRAKIIDRWQQLEAVVMTKPAAPVFVSSPMVQAMEFAEAVSNMLHLEGSARLGVARKVTSIVAPHLLPALPTYAIDAPADGGATSSEPTASLTTLLKQKNVKMTAAKANKILQDLDIIEQVFRPSSSGTERSFWTVTPIGKKYGKNVTSPTNQLETQPHWFIRQADTLVHLISTHAQ